MAPEALTRRCPAFLILLFTVIPFNRSVPLDLQGQLAGWGTSTDLKPGAPSTLVGVRYIPSLSLGLSPSQGTAFDLELSGNFSTLFSAGHPGEFSDRLTVRSYRWWLRVKTSHFESRLGLQKINFGPAKLLRSLMWFDRLDPQDPLQLAEGVYGLRLRYDFQNNANIWLWGLYGNRGIKGIEITPTEEKSPEYGGRFQYPVGNGEMAVTTHSRVIDISGERISEKRIALDGVWDVGIGVLFESALIRTDLDDSELGWQSFLTLGMDYTFEVGNGLTVLGEHLLFTVDDTPFGTATKRNMSGLMVLYPMGLMDQLSYFSFYDWNDNLPYCYVSWQRNYDSWIYHLSVFWSRVQNRSAKESQSITNSGRRGVQLMIIFNH